MTRAIAPATQHIARDILVLRGQRVIIDGDLAALYGVTTKPLTNRSDVTASASPKISCSSSPPRRLPL